MVLRPMLHFLGRPLYCFICVRMKTVKFSVHKHNLSSPPLTAYTEIILKMVLKDKECNVRMNFTHRCICFLLGRKFYRASLCNSFVMKVCPIQSEHFDVLWHFYVQMKLILKVLLIFSYCSTLFVYKWLASNKKYIWIPIGCWKTFFFYKNIFSFYQTDMEEIYISFIFVWNSDKCFENETKVTTCL